MGNKEKGPTPSDFAYMVNDDNGSCYCGDNELRDILEEMIDGFEDLPLMNFNRELLIRKLFIACKPQPNDYLNMNSMRMFASFKGFKGSAGEWMKEYMAMCHDYSWDETLGCNLQGFSELVSNESAGAYCSNGNLREVLTELAL